MKGLTEAAADLATVVFFVVVERTERETGWRPSSLEWPGALSC